MSERFNFSNHGKGKKREEQEKPDTEENENYPTPGNVRNICFVLADGKQVFLNYAYLVSGEYSPDDSTITLNFTTHVVKLKGSNLEELFKALNRHEPKKAIAINKRYKDIELNGFGLLLEEILINNNSEAVG